MLATGGKFCVSCGTRVNNENLPTPSSENLESVAKQESARNSAEKIRLVEIKQQAEAMKLLEAELAAKAERRAAEERRAAAFIREQKEQVVAAQQRKENIRVKRKQRNAVARAWFRSLKPKFKAATIFLIAGLLVGSFVAGTAAVAAIQTEIRRQTTANHLQAIVDYRIQLSNDQNHLIDAIAKVQPIVDKANETNGLAQQWGDVEPRRLRLVDALDSLNSAIRVRKVDQIYDLSRALATATHAVGTVTSQVVV